MSDENLYQLIANELEENKTDRLLWTRALGESGGDSEKTKAQYIRLRLAALKASIATSFGRSDSKPSNENQMKALDNGLALVRTALAKALLDGKKSSFYSVLSITPEATDSAVALAIAEYETRVDNGVAMASPEFKYAKEALGNPKTRENYDRRLFARFVEGELSPVRERAKQDRYVESDNVVLSLWASRKSAVIVGALATVVLGYMLLGFYRERGVNEARKNVIDAQVLQTSRTADNDATRAGTERVLVDGVIRNGERVIATQGQVANRVVNIQESAENRQSRELEYRANAGAEVLRQEQDRLKIANEQLKSNR